MPPVLAQCCMRLEIVRRHSVAAVGRDEEGGSLAGEHRVAHTRSVAVRAANADAAEACEERCTWARAIARQMVS
jgi:hypothetical protein